jgi:hypothetical protein
MSMKRLGSLLMALGVVVGAGAAAWIGVGLERAGLPWLVAVGLVKLIVVASLGILAAGAMVARVANRREEAERRRELMASLDGGLRPQQEGQVDAINAQQNRPLDSR